MIIRKLFKFENAHIVRDCSSKRCKYSIHGHSYKIEVLLESNYLDNGQMVYDFGLTKFYIKELIDSFDHAITLWSADDKGYIKDMQNNSKRWVLLPVSPSAEQFSRVIFLMVEKVLDLTVKNNAEREVKVNSVIVHETDTGYAQGFYEDAHSKMMGEIDLKDIEFSQQIKSEWSDENMWEKILQNKLLEIPSEI